MRNTIDAKELLKEMKQANEKLDIALENYGEMEDLVKTIMDLASPATKKSIEKDLKALDKKVDIAVAEKNLKVAETLHFIFNHPEKEKMITITNPIKNGWVSIASEGQFSELFLSAMACPFGEITWNREIEKFSKKKHSMNSSLTYEEFKKLFLTYYCENAKLYEKAFEDFEKNLQIKTKTVRTHSIIS